jgi:GTPase Era involved in 16S rRNA processing
MDLANENKTLALLKANTEPEADIIHISTKKSQNVSKLLTFIQQNVSP